jgi:hypothetical protein
MQMHIKIFYPNLSLTTNITQRQIINRTTSSPLLNFSYQLRIKEKIQIVIKDEAKIEVQ